MTKVATKARASNTRGARPRTLADFKHAVSEAAELEAHAADWPGIWWSHVRAERDAPSGLNAIRARERKSAKQRVARDPQDVHARFDAIEARDGSAPISRHRMPDRVKAREEAAAATGYELPRKTKDGTVFPLNTPEVTRAFLAALNLPAEEEPSAEGRSRRLVAAFANPFGERAPSARDLGLAALLAGEWPAVQWQSDTIANVIRAMTESMRKLHSREGARVRQLKKNG